MKMIKLLVAVIGQQAMTSLIITVSEDLKVVQSHCLMANSLTQCHLFVRHRFFAAQRNQEPKPE